MATTTRSGRKSGMVTARDMEREKAWGRAVRTAQSVHAYPVMRVPSLPADVFGRLQRSLGDARRTLAALWAIADRIERSDLPIEDQAQISAALRFVHESLSRALEHRPRAAA